MLSRGSGNAQMDLNGSSPAANVVRLGDTLVDLIAAVNALTARNNLLVSLLVAASGASVPVLTTVTALAAPVAVPNRFVAPVAPEITTDLP